MAYCTIEDVRDEGFQDCDAFIDARVQKAVDAATRDIDRFLKRNFEPRKLTFRRTWKGSPQELLLDDPVIALDRVQFVNTDGTLGEILEASEFEVFNRHVTQGLTEPDDREDPKLAFIFLLSNFLIPGAFTRNRVVDLRRAFDLRVLNVELEGWFGYTDPEFSGTRSIASDAADAITAPDTIKMTNGAFTVSDRGRTITIAGSSTTNDGGRRIIAVPAADTVTVDGTVLVTEGTGFTASIAVFPQFGVTPGGIAEACLRMAIKRLPTLATVDSIDAAVTGGRVRRMAVRDQSIELTKDTRLTSGGGGSGFTGDPAIDSLLVQFMRPPKFGAA